MKKLWQKIYVSDWFDPIHDFYVKIVVFLKNIERSYSYAKFVWGKVDFDYTSSLDILEFSFNRLEHAIQHGHLLHKERWAKRLRIMREYLKRMTKDERPYAAHYDYLDKVYGEIKMKCEPADPEKKYFRIVERNKKRETPEAKKHIRRVYNHIAEMEKRDIQEFSRLFNKYITYMWD